VGFSIEYFVKDLKVYEYEWESTPYDKGSWQKFRHKMTLDGYKWLSKDNKIEKVIIDNFINQKSKQMKTSKVTQVVSVKPWTSTNGTIQYCRCVMENGDKIEIGKKKPVEVGWELTYEITGDAGQEYTKAKAVQPEQAPSSNQGTQAPRTAFVDNTKGMKIGHAITNAVNLHVALGSFPNNSKDDMMSSIKEYAKMIYQISEELNQEL